MEKQVTYRKEIVSFDESVDADFSSEGDEDFVNQNLHTKTAANKDSLLQDQPALETKGDGKGLVRSNQNQLSKKAWMEDYLPPRKPSRPSKSVNTSDEIGAESESEHEEVE